jgi:hypothetical protein
MKKQERGIPALANEEHEFTNKHEYVDDMSFNF